jgi:hypothetical protein
MEKKELDNLIDTFIGYFNELKKEITTNNAHNFEVVLESKKSIRGRPIDSEFGMIDSTVFKLSVNKFNYKEKDEIRVSGKCFICGYEHENDLTSFFIKDGKKTRCAKCIQCGKELPYKINGCTCYTESLESEIKIGDCPIHQFLKEESN